MATLDKAFRVKNGLVVEGTNGTINGSDIITEDKITGGTQSGISVTYVDGNVNFNVEDPNISISGDATGENVINDLGDTDVQITLNTVNSNTGSFGGQTKIPTFTVNGKGLITAAGEVDVATNLSIAGDTGSDTVSLLTDTLTVAGGEGVDVAVTDNTITVSAEDASSSNKGVASFDATDFTVTSGAVAVNTTTLGTTTLNPGETTSTLAGLEQLDVDNVRVNGNTISSTDTDGDIVLNPNGAGKIDASSSRIVNVSAPLEGADAVNKSYVDSVVEGLTVHEAVRVATTENITLSPAPTTIDGVTLATDDRVLVKDQTNLAENGIYVLNLDGDLVRAEDYDSPTEIAGGDFVYVTAGSTYAGTGWVQVDNVGTVGTDPVEWSQFSGAGTFTAGYGLTLDGTEFNVDNDVIVNQTNLSDAVTDLTEYVDSFLNSTDGTTVEYIDTQDAATLLSATEYSDALVASGDPTATPTYEALDVNSVALQVASTVTVTGTSATTVYAFSKADYRSAKFLVKLAYGTHTEVSEVLLTLDTSDNVAITEFAVVGTNGSASTISAAVVGTDVNLLVTPTNSNSTITVFGTLLI